MSDWEEKGQEGGERRGVSWGLASASWCGGRWVPSCGVIRSGGVQPGGRRLVSGHQPGASGRCGGGGPPRRLPVRRGQPSVEVSGCVL